MTGARSASGDASATWPRLAGASAATPIEKPCCVGGSTPCPFHVTGASMSSRSGASSAWWVRTKQTTSAMFELSIPRRPIK